MNNDLRDKYLAAYDAKASHDADYEALNKQYDGDVPFSEAVKLAEKRLMRIKNPPKPGSSGTPFYEGFAAAQEYLSAHGAWNRAAFIAMIEDSRENYWSHLALAAAAAITHDKSAMPELMNWERDYLAKLIDIPTRPAGKSPYANLHRDQIIVSELERLQKVGFKPTRNKSEGSSKNSGCDVIVKALANIGEARGYDAVASIWQNKNKAPNFTAISNAFLVGLNNLP